MRRVTVNQDELRGVFLPIEESQLLLPNAAVAEVVSYKEPTTIPGAPEWFLGELEWRQQRIPIVSFEQALNITEKAQAKRVKIAICNTLNGSSELPFIGVVLQSIPRLVRVRTDNISYSDQEDLNPLILHKVLLQGESALIPNLDRLEEKVIQAVEQIVVNSF